MSIGSYLNFVLSLIFVLGLIGLVAWAYRRFFSGGGLVARLGGATRLTVVEMRALDARHKLVLVRRDGIEHLLLLGTTSNTVIEVGITPPTTNTDGANMAAKDARETKR